MAELNETGVKIVPNPQPEIGMDIDNVFADSILSAASVQGLDVGSIDALSQKAQTRELIYELLDQMLTDDMVSSIVETYAGDITQPNDKGKIIWVESEDSNVSSYCNWLVESLNLDAVMYKWAYHLLAYGDVYVQLFRKSDYEDDILFKNNKRNKQLNESKKRIEESKVEGLRNKADNKTINEDVILKLYSSNDPYIPYVDLYPNPVEIYDLQKFGKTYGYIKAPVRVVQSQTDELLQYQTRYSMKQTDVEVYDAMSFAHACIETTNQRQPETIDIYLNDYINGTDEEKLTEEESVQSASYRVRRGQSILYNSYRVWRELSLLEMSALLNRLTKSSVIRIVTVNVGDMPKEQVRGYMQRLKEKIEQKAAINEGKGMAEYTAPGPIENTIYIPVHGDQGSINFQSLGGDFDPKSLVDLEYFRDKFFGSFQIPKAFFGYTSDGAGFNGGTSLSIISAQYGKTVKKMQNLLCQLVRDIINLFLIDRNLENYVNRFTVRMEPPVTQAEIDRRQNADNRIRYVGDLVNLLSDVDDKITKLKLLNSLLRGIVNDPDVMEILGNYIKQLELAEKAEKEPKKSEEENGGGGTSSEPLPSGPVASESEESMPEPELTPEVTPEPEPAEDILPTFDEISNEDFTHSDDKDLLMEDGGDSYLPSPEELGL